MNAMQLHFANIEKRYGTRCVLRIDTLNFLPGRLVHLTGCNGAGKTTLFKILAGLEPPDRCTVHLEGCDLAWTAARVRLQRHVVYLHQQPYMFDASVRDNLEYGLRVTGVARAERRVRVREALERLDLDAAARRNARTLSGGERQRLALARAWVLAPRVLLLDEPTANMDSDFRRHTWTLLQGMLREDLAIMVSSHELSATECPDCVNLHLHDGRLGAAQPRLRLVDAHWPEPSSQAGAGS